MPIRLCLRGHITGFQHCARCGAKAVRNIGGDPIRRRMDKRVKRAITNAIREAGGKPAADLRRELRIGWAPNIPMHRGGDYLLPKGMIGGL